MLSPRTCTCPPKMGLNQEEQDTEEFEHLEVYRVNMHYNHLTASEYPWFNHNNQTNKSYRNENAVSSWSLRAKKQGISMSDQLLGLKTRSECRQNTCTLWNTNLDLYYTMTNQPKEPQLWSWQTSKKYQGTHVCIHWFVASNTQTWHNASC